MASSDASLAPFFLSELDQARALQWVKNGLSRGAIAQRLKVDLMALGEWLAHEADQLDTTEAARIHMRRNALPMADSIIRDGRPMDHIKALEGLDVLSSQDTRGGLTIVVGGSAQVQVNIGTVDTGVTLGETKRDG